MKLNKRFRAFLQKSPRKGGWTYVVLPLAKKPGNPATVALEERLERGDD